MHLTLSQPDRFATGVFPRGTLVSAVALRPQRTLREANKSWSCILSLIESKLGASAFFIRAYFETTETTCKNNFFFSPRNYAAFLNRRAVARRKGKLFQTSCFPSLEDVVVNYTDAPLRGAQ